MTVNRNAQTALQANQFAVDDFKTCINNIHAIPSLHRVWIKNQISSVDAITNLHVNNPAAGVVEVNTNFEGISGHGVRYRLNCMLDVDIPPPHSTQAPHFGWEVQFNGMRVGNGHVWLPTAVLAWGRPPPPGGQLETYHFGPGLRETEISGNGKINMECSFRRYK